MYLYSLMASYAVDAFEPIATWLTVAVIATLLVVGVVLFFVKRTVVGKYAKFALFGAFAYLLVIAILFIALDFAKHYSDSYAEENWLDKQTVIRFMLTPLLVLAVVTLLSLVTYALIANKKPSAKKLVGRICFAVCFVTLIASLICLSAYYEKKISNDGYYNSDVASVKQIALYVASMITVAIIVGLAFFDKEKLVFNARSLAYAGICVSMSFALSYVKLFSMPQGGSITLVSLLPLMLFAYAFGAKKGVFVGFVYGVLQAVQTPWLIHPAQFLLDYPIAFSAIGLAGLFKNVKAFEKLPQLQFTLGACVAGTLRFACHVLSGVFAFEVSAVEVGKNVWLYSVVYNSFVFIDVLLVVIAGAFVLSSKNFQKALPRAEDKKADDVKNA